MPLASWTAPLTSALEGVYFQMVHNANGRVPVMFLVTRAVLSELARHELDASEFLDAFEANRCTIERLASDTFDRAGTKPARVITVGIRELRER